MPCGFTVFVPLQSLNKGNDISLAIYLYRCMKDERAKNDPRLFMLNAIPKVNSATLIDGMNYQCDNRLFLVDIRVYTLLSINHTLFLSLSLSHSYLLTLNENKLRSLMFPIYLLATPNNCKYPHELFGTFRPNSYPFLFLLLSFHSLIHFHFLFSFHSCFKYRNLLTALCC